MIYSVEFKVKGISHYYDEFFKKFAQENEDFKLTNKELKEDFQDGDKVYKYEYTFSEVKLVPEPDNKYDPNAVRVEVDGCLIGYIDKVKTGRVKELLADPNFRRVELEIGGGDYKYIYEDEDDKLQVEKDECEPFADVLICMFRESEPTTDKTSPAAVTSAPAEGAPVKVQEPRKMGGLLLVLGILIDVASLLILLFNPIVGLIFLVVGVLFIVTGVKAIKKRKAFLDGGKEP